MQWKEESMPLQDAVLPMVSPIALARHLVRPLLRRLVAETGTTEQEDSTV